MTVQVARPEANLIPIDPSDAAEQEVLRLQRVICGWKEETIPEMCAQMQQGQRLLCWVGFASTEAVYVSVDGETKRGPKDPSSENGEHFFKMPVLKSRDLAQLKSPMLNASAIAKGTTVETGYNGYVPVGHVSIDAGDFDENPSSLLYPPDGRTLSLTTLFILPCYRQYKLGTWAMGECEHLIRGGVVTPLHTDTTGETAPGRCKTVTLSTLSERHFNKDDPEMPEYWRLVGAQSVYHGPWYSRLGYSRYHEQLKWLKPIMDRDGRDTGGRTMAWAEFWRKEI